MITRISFNTEYYPFDFSSIYIPHLINIYSPYGINIYPNDICLVYIKCTQNTILSANRIISSRNSNLYRILSYSVAFFVNDIFIYNYINVIIHVLTNNNNTP